jgi:transcriptional antiterminator RfaH
LEAQRERVAQHFLSLNGYQTYLPRLRERRIVRGRRIEVCPPLFPGYLFLQIANGWWHARWSIGVSSLIMDGTQPAHVPDAIIDEIRSREGRDGLIQLAPPPGLRPGDRVRVLQGPFAGHLALYAGMRPRERVLVLLQLLGSAQRVAREG